jgi:ketosteroid isomerase-like protein
LEGELKTRTWIVCFLLVSFAAAAQVQNGEAAKVLALEKAWNAAQRDHDNAALEPILAETFIDTEADGTVMDRGRYLAYIKDPGIKHLSLTSSDLKVVLFENGALVNGTYHDKGTEKGQSYEIRGRFTDTWVLRNGKWRCVASASTPLPLK